jgi:hypothetical protein
MKFVLEEIDHEKLLHMTSSKLTNLLIVATLPASWHDLCKNASDPSGDSSQEGFPVIWLE